MVRWGRFLEWFIGPYIGLKPTVLHIQLGFWSVWGMFRPEIDWTTGLEITLAAGLMIAQFVRLNKRASFEIDSRFVRIYFGEEQGYDLKIKTMEYPIFISKPVPVVLMLDNRQVVEIEDLHSEEEYLAIMRGIEEGIERYDKV